MMEIHHLISNSKGKKIMKKMSKANVKATAAACLIVFSTSLSNAQDKTEVSLGADIVSSYIWRGQNLAGVSVQPGISIAKSGLKVAAWGSVGIESKDTKEFDLMVSYSTGGFSIGITDYWFDYPTEGRGPRYFNYSSHSTDHVFEANVAYDFGLVSILWNTNFAGFDYYKKDEERAYSTYAEIKIPFTVGGFGFSAEAGVTPWEGAYSDGFNVVNIGLTGNKDIKISDSFIIPAFAKITVNPYTEKTYFTFGISL